MRRKFISALLVALTFALAVPVHAKGTRVQEPKDFDRLDGHGPTAKKVDVIEWEGNLEIHVYPKGALKSLGMKIDHDSKSTKNNVMVIEYGFNGVAYTLIRRAILSIPMPDTFKAFRDESATDYDKIMISGNGIAGVKPYALAPAPTQLYPDYSPSLTADEVTGPAAVPAGDPTKSYRKNASEGAAGSSGAEPTIQLRKTEDVEQDALDTRRRQTKTPSTVDEDGGIRNFAF